MGKIRQLDDNLSNLIAAGEVVENMASVVKELVENSIDASSKNIIIELEESGLNEIKVIDDGEGMAKSDMLMSVKRHATSKIKTSHDLFHINSLGFRGEALPSIASVSHLEIISSEGVIGHRLFYLKGELKESNEFAPRKGTTISVRYLFYNTPARLKHLKASNTELSYIVDYINKIALSHPEISFTLSNNKRQIFKSSGTNDVLKVLSNIYNIDIIKNMISFEGKNQFFTVSGFLTKPMFNRSSRSHITVIANNRMIKNNKVINAVTEGFKTYLPIGKYPIVFLKIDLDPLLIDVNVHPQKLEVKFTEERMLLSLIRETVKEKLKSLMLIPEMKESKKEDPYKYQTLNLKTSEEKPSLAKEDFVNYISNLVEKKKEKEIINPQIVQEEKQKPIFDKANAKSFIVANEEMEKDFLTIKETEKLPRLEYIGQYLGTYLIAQNDEGLYLIDQHAAAERIRYEDYYTKMANVEVNSTTLLIPITLNLSNQEVLAVKDRLDELVDFGIKLIANDYHGIDIISVPSWFPKDFERSYTEEIVKYLIDGRDVTIGDVRNNLAKNLSCKHSIKANKFINKNEIEKLLIDLSNCENPYTCPHGRPVVIRWTQNDIEKMFKRIM